LRPGRLGVGKINCRTELLAVFGNPDFGSEAELIAQQTETSSPLAMRASEMTNWLISDETTVQIVLD